MLFYYFHSTCTFSAKAAMAAQRHWGSTNFFVHKLSFNTPAPIQPHSDKIPLEWANSGHT